jgi:hypothetical protein
MTDKWYFARGAEEFGPYTAAQLKELGSAGKVEATDVVWKEGMDRRVPAIKVKNLLSAVLATEGAAEEEEPEAPPEGRTAAADTTSPLVADPTAPEPEKPESSIPPEEPAAEEATGAPEKRPPAQYQERKKRVVGTKGATVQSQDGKYVRFRKKCIKCGCEDRGMTTMGIRTGTTRLSFFCPKCKKLHPVEITGV